MSRIPEEVDLDLEVLTGLLVDLEERDDHILGVVERLLDKTAASTELTSVVRSAACVALREVRRILSNEELFSSGYRLLCSAVDDLQRVLIIESSQVPASTGVGEGSSADGALFQISSSAGEVAAFISESRENLDSAESALIALEGHSSDSGQLNEVFRCFHNIKGASGFLNLRDVQELAHIAESLMEEARSGRTLLEGQAADLAFTAVDLMRDMMDGLERAAEGGSPRETPESLDFLVGRIREFLSMQGTDGGAATGHDGADIQVSKGDGVRKMTKKDELVRVSTGRLDSLIDAVGELAIANSMVVQETRRVSSSPGLTQAVDRTTKVIRELQELAMGVRMVSLEGTFRKMARVVRDLSAKTATDVDFAFSGGDTELDRSMVEEMSNPLVHLVRNAMDHGIEVPEERRRLGKPEKGRLRLSAFHQGGNVVIRVEDDGRGLDALKIRAKAEGLGLVKPDAGLVDRDIYQFIYHPGFSTAKEVTEVSGRGVGMDVVKQSIEGLRGRIDVATSPGHGTTFIIRLPLTMAIIDGMIVSVGPQRYILPKTAIQESLRPVREQLLPIAGKGELMRVREELLPLVRLHRVLGIAGARLDPCSALTLIVGDKDQRYGLLVDDLIGQQQVVVKPLDGIFRGNEAISGSAILGDGKVALILDVTGLMRITKGA